MSSAFYQSKEWRALRTAVLKRDPVCVVRGCGRPATHADHIIPRERGGADSMGNLRGLCQSCHNRRSANGTNAEPRAVGCHPDGTPRDPGHPWADAAVQPGAATDFPHGAANRAGVKLSVSSESVPAGRRRGS